ncbi:MAG: hypothetical protein JWL84_3483 [Rhodospirillales bacterium]|nr:hypothetical protein [Rhodospirillales bacterium]
MSGRSRRRLIGRFVAGHRRRPCSCVGFGPDLDSDPRGVTHQHTLGGLPEALLDHQAAVMDGRRRIRDVPERDSGTGHAVSIASDTHRLNSRLGRTRIALHRSGPSAGLSSRAARLPFRT